jgi:hypothetical protein
MLRGCIKLDFFLRLFAESDWAHGKHWWVSLYHVSKAILSIIFFYIRFIWWVLCQLACTWCDVLGVVLDSLMANFCFPSRIFWASISIQFIHQTFMAWFSSFLTPLVCLYLNQGSDLEARCLNMNMEFSPFFCTVLWRSFCSIDHSLGWFDKIMGIAGLWHSLLLMYLCYLCMFFTGRRFSQCHWKSVSVAKLCILYVVLFAIRWLLCEVSE